MKSLLFASLLTLSAVVASSADSPSFSGKWKVHSSIAGTEGEADCTLAQKENAITGSCTNDQGSQNLTGKVDGLKVEWSYDSEYNGTPLVLKYTGTLDAATSKISGTVNVAPFDVDGDFTATLAK